MHPLEAPGPDGLPATFSQTYWPIVGEEVCNLVLVVLDRNRDPRSLNSTQIANRIKHILPEVICEEQGAFVQGRLITDNALVAIE